MSTPTFFPVMGGAEKGIHEIYSRLAQRHDVTILTPTLPARVTRAYGARECDLMHESDYEVRRFAQSEQGLTRRLGLATARAVSAAIRGESYNVANFHYVGEHASSLLAARRHGVPVALSLVGRADVYAQMNHMARVRARLSFALAAATLPISDFYYAGMPRKTNLEVIPYGVDSDVYTPSDRDGTAVRERFGFAPNHHVLLAVQRLAPIKRVDCLIRTMPLLLKRVPTARLLIVGHGEEQSALHALVSELGLMDVVRLVGFVAEGQLPDVYAAADIFVTHSLSETFGIMFAEAMSAGLPIVAADASSTPYVVRHGVNGLLVPPFDFRAFAEAIALLVDDEGLRATIRRNNRREAVDRFNWDRIAVQYESVLRRIAC